MIDRKISESISGLNVSAHLTNNTNYYLLRKPISSKINDLILWNVYDHVFNDIYKIVRQDK